MTHTEFESRINALAIELGASVELEKVGNCITNAAFMVGRRVAFYITYNSFFDKIETCDSNGHEMTIEPDLMRVYAASNYYIELGKHLDEVADILGE